MAKTKKPEQAIFYQNFKGAIYGGTPEQVKNLMTAFCQYAFDGVEEPKVAPDIAMTFSCPKRNLGVWGFLKRGCCGLMLYCPELYSIALVYTELQIL